MRRALPSLVLAVLAACDGEDPVAAGREMATQAVCLKVCLTSNKASCETYCPPAKGCQLICNPAAQVSGTEDPTSDAATKVPGKSGLCQWSCPSEPPTCQPVCDEACLKSFAATSVGAATDGQVPAEAQAQCCKDACPPPPPPPCATATNAGAVDCQPPPPPPPPCSQQCDMQCLAALKAQGMSDPTLVEKCCQQASSDGTKCEPPAPPPPPPPAPCGTNGCDKGCIDSLLKAGFSDQEAHAKCCDTVCSDKK